MRKTLACSILIVTSSLLGCGKDKHQEPAMAPAAGEQWEQRPQTAPGYSEPQAPAQPETQQAPSEWQEPSGMGQPGMNEQPAATDPWAGESQAGDMDARMLSEALCRREMRCNQIGDNKKYSSTEECESKLQSEGSTLLQSCNGSVNRDALTQCTTAIQSKSCDSKLSGLSDFDQCRTSTLCKM
jgi:hypothetical protein